MCVYTQRSTCILHSIPSYVLFDCTARTTLLYTCIPVDYLYTCYGCNVINKYMYFLEHWVLSWISMEMSWNDERGEWEFEKMTKITQYRHNINTSIKNRVIVSFYNVSYGLSDSWFAKKRKNIFLHVQPILFFFFDLTFLWFLIFFNPNWVPCETCGGKILPVFQIPSK